MMFSLFIMPRTPIYHVLSVEIKLEELGVPLPQVQHKWQHRGVEYMN